MSCSHDRAIWYFIESLGVNGCHFPAFPCSSWQQFKGGNCTSCNSTPCPDMGINAVHTNASGKHFLTTLPNSPFCSKYIYRTKKSCTACIYHFLLAHLSRRLIGELIVYRGVRRPSSVRRPSVRQHFQKTSPLKP